MALMHPPPSPRQNAQFTTTHWSVVLAAGGGDSPAARQALEHLCQTYWYPVYAYVRRRDNSPEDAEDLTQEFFAKLIERNDFAKVSRDRGPFRAFLKSALNHLLSDRRDYVRAAKRGGGKIILSLDAQTAEQRYQLEPADMTTPDKLYDRRWALTLLEKARSRLAEEYGTAGKSELYNHLKFLEPGAPEVLSYAEIGRRLGKSESAIKTEASRLHRRYRQLVRGEVAQTVASALEIDDEVRYLLAVVAA
ncbi:MAG TPA: sigma-70 family RNA polymerase sigma factor [Dongiaceae bacterium]|nr:sigma-70 family RNA polymerase sigma factor [Dongiaceae bacterium]